MDYEFKTTFWDDFNIAEYFGLPAIRDTFNRAKEEWKDDIIYLTELVLVTNWKCWQYWEVAEETSNPNVKEVCEAVSMLYSELYYKVRDFVYETYGEDEEAMKYYFETTD